MSSVLGAERAGEIADESRFLQLCRIGFVGRGLLYLLIGIMVLGTGRTEDMTGALEYIGRGSGRLLILAISAGMAAYGLWRLADAAFGIETHGKAGKAIRKRAAVGVVGLIYLYLAYKALTIAMAGDAGASQQADTVLDLPGGGIVLGVAALVLIGAGLNQLRKAFTCDFLRTLDHRVQSQFVRWLGRFGYAARGVIFILVGLLIGRAAIDGRSNELAGMEEALDLLSGPVLYAVAAGLMLFGAFSVVEGLFRRIQEPPVDEMKQQVRGAVG